MCALRLVLQEMSTSAPFFDYSMTQTNSLEEQEWQNAEEISDSIVGLHSKAGAQFLKILI